jgi:hypothetical protein
VQEHCQAGIDLIENLIIERLLPSQNHDNSLQYKIEKLEIPSINVGSIDYIVRKIKESRKKVGILIK